jgi:exodeoxyribonuclease-3
MISFLEQEFHIWILKAGIFVDFDEMSVMSLYLPSGTNSERLIINYVYGRFPELYNRIKATIPNLVIRRL